MESPAQHEERVARLEADRARRRAVVPSTFDDGPVEIAPGRGDLSVSSQSWYGGTDQFWVPDFLLANRQLSFAKLFCTQPWIGAAVMRMLTWSVRVPIKCYIRTGDDSRQRLREDDHPMAKALIEPWDRGNMASLVMSLLGPILVHGNSITEVEDVTADRIWFKPKDWRYSSPIRPWRDSLEGFKVDTDSAQFAREVSIDQMLHIAWWSPAGPIGTSPLQQLGVTLDIEQMAQKFQRATFKNMARPASAIEASDDFLGLDRDERTDLLRQLREDVIALYAGPDNAGRPALLPPGLKWHEVGHSSVEAELIDQRKLARDEVASVYMIPPPMLGILDKATYSNIETQREMIYTDCLGPPLVLIEQAINAQIIRSLLGQTDVYVEFDFAGVLRGDRLKEIQALREAIGMAMLTPNEARSKLNEQRSTAPGMDQFYLPTNNLQPVGTPPRSAPSAPPAGSQGRTLHVESRDASYALEYA